VTTSLPARLAVDVDGCFEELVRTEQHLVFSVALRLTLDRRDAEEVAQEAFVRAYRALGGYAPPRIRALRVRPWLATIVVNVQRNRVRRKRPTTVGESASDWGTREPVAAAADGPEEQAEAAERRARVAGLLATLPEMYRLAVTLRHIEGLSYGEAAEVLGRPVGTVKAQVHRGIELLRNALEEEGTAREERP
jgi:RNA polymerase sigma-70 factor (ECF subfamily)